MKVSVGLVLIAFAVSATAFPGNRNRQFGGGNRPYGGGGYNQGGYNQGGKFQSFYVAIGKNFL